MALTRREFVTGLCAAGAGALGSQYGLAAETATPSEPFTFVHLTDMHVTPLRHGDEGYRACLASVAALRPKPAFLMMGGDMAFDGSYHSRAELAEQVRLFKEATDAVGIPYYPCMGNHDPLGLSSRRKVSTDDPEFGKKFIMNRLGWEKSYYSFDHGRWHFVVLDSIYPVMTEKGPGYEVKIGPEQLEWLAYDLGAAAGRPTIAVTHVAAFCNAGQIKGDSDAKAMGRVVSDNLQLRTILERHKVKALLQGHNHRIEEYRLNGVWYLTSAAASGGWWSGDWVGSAPGYTVFRCSGDRLSWTHHTFDWKPRLEPGDDLERRLQAEYDAFQAEQRELLEIERTGRKPWPAQENYQRR